jgi:hypothetical protein
MDMLATVEKILKIDAHPNADSLEIATVLGYQCIVRKGAHSVGEAIVFIQPDSVLPADREWASEVIKYTSGNGRVKAVRLRGSWSMGLVMPLSILAAGEPRLVLDGQEVSKMLGIIAYEAPIPKNLNAKGGLPFGMPRTDESRWQNVRDLDTLLGNLVDVTLKVDGSSFTAYCVLPGDHPGDAPLLGITSRSPKCWPSSPRIARRTASRLRFGAKSTARAFKPTGSIRTHGKSVVWRSSRHGTFASIAIMDGMTRITTAAFARLAACQKWLCWKKAFRFRWLSSRNTTKSLSRSAASRSKAS